MNTLSKNSDNILYQLIKYFFVGSAAFIIDYGTIFILTEYIGAHYLWSAAIAFFLGLITNYILSILWVFARNQKNSIWKEFLVFSAIGLIGLLLNELIMYYGSEILNFHYMVSKLCSTAIVFFWNFFARKLLLFNHKK